ncbi:hypothetical protein FHS78_000303 [Parvibaculum indicum]|uniref:DUF3572 domain-containing protein n=1 Tax=Parvibaculum indicum TaxID=562969 RepID=UPI001FE33CB8|nr:DUF3572 domain-containing protein [Parvibaculum indicum]NIJ40048.1 hypothetical protein [Parvibaculum indicum]
MKRDRAETIAIKALTFMAHDQDLMGAFLAQSGLSPDELRERLNEPGFLIGVLDFLLMEDERVLAFCAAEGLSPETPLAARHALPGGEHVNWT